MHPHRALWGQVLVRLIPRAFPAPEIWRAESTGKWQIPVGTVLCYSLPPTLGQPCQPTINSLCPYSRYPFQSIVLSSLGILTESSPGSAISALPLYGVLIHPLLFISSDVCCFCLSWAKRLKDFTEDQLISRTWHPARAVFFQWKQIETLPYMGYIHYPQICFLDLSGCFHRHSL